MRNIQSGFTLIELVMVIVILGILAAFALPKFADLSGEASIATARGGLGAVKSAAGITHAAFLARGSNNPVTIEGTPYTMVNGYPQCQDIGELANLDGFTPTPNPPAGCDAAGTIVYTLDGTGCTFTYNEAALNAAPTYVAAACP